MASFVESHIVHSVKLHEKVSGVKPRGGASIIDVNGVVIIFGGADRTQQNFQDLIVLGKPDCKSRGTKFESVTATGDIPMPRSGHSVAAYGKYMLLFGGIDFSEEAVYNDLYALDTETFCWSYVGESGAEVTARNSHSMAVLTCTATTSTISESNSFNTSDTVCAMDAKALSGRNGTSPGQRVLPTPPLPSTVSVLVIYGGASPEHGPLGDTLYALLPPMESIDMKEFFVSWQVLGGTQPVQTADSGSSKSSGSNDQYGEGAAVKDFVGSRNTVIVVSGVPASESGSDGAKIASPSPGAREMHGTCALGNTMIITGGRSGSGAVLSDVWALQLLPSRKKMSSSAFSRCNGGGEDTAEASSVWTLSWEKLLSLDLENARCAHGAALTATEKTISSTSAAPCALSGSTSVSFLARSVNIFLYGGFTGDGISNELLRAELPSSTLRVVFPWEVVEAIALKDLKEMEQQDNYAVNDHDNNYDGNRHFGIAAGGSSRTTESIESECSIIQTGSSITNKDSADGGKDHTNQGLGNTIDVLGCTGRGVAGDKGGSDDIWRGRLPSKPIEARFGLALTPVGPSALNWLFRGSSGRPTTAPATSASGKSKGACGGSNNHDNKNNSGSKYFPLLTPAMKEAISEVLASATAVATTTGTTTGKATAGELDSECSNSRGATVSPRASLLMFGGVCMEEDFGDIWFILA